MNVCFLLHFYQPSNQFGDVFKKITQECYIPFVKLLKNNKTINITANFSLSLLEQLDRYGYSLLITDIRDLVEQGRIELVGSAAYHSLLTKIPKELAFKQIMLNELAQGYYFGTDKDFEGQACYMIKNLKGFFPPEMAITAEVLETINDMGYEWVILDDYCLPEDVRRGRTFGTCYSIGNHSPKLIIRDRAISNLLSFKRTVDRKDIVDAVVNSPGDKVVALDAETFGHHYRDGIYLFESLVADLRRLRIDVTTVSQVFDHAECKNIESIEESTWSSIESAIYPMWENPQSPVNTALWELSKLTHALVAQGFLLKTLELTDNHDQGVAPKPIWKCDTSLDIETKALLNLLKLEQSDAFWWSTGVELGGEVNFSPYMVASVLNYYNDLIDYLGGNSALSQKILEINDMLKGVTR